MDIKLVDTKSPGNTRNSPRSSSDRDPRRRRHARAITAAGVVLLLIVIGATVLLRNDGADTASKSRDIPATGATLPIFTPTDAALALYVAWQRGSATEADRASTTSGAKAMLEIPTTAAPGLAFAGCTTAEHQRSTCTWERTDARLTMSVTSAPNHRPQVTTTTFTEL